MRSIIFALFTALVSTSCTTNSPAKITRYTINPWENEIGYAAVVQVENTFHVSGVTCGGENYQVAVSTCYKELGDILTRYQLTSQSVVKETIYALDIEALQKQIPVRKNFYRDGKYPAATWVQVSRLYGPEHLIEIELVAVK
jgi:2-iminobutanoate/2-iminopropanoate deaminase